MSCQEAKSSFIKEISLVRDSEPEGESQASAHMLRVCKAVDISRFSSINHWVINYWIVTYYCSYCEKNDKVRQTKATGNPIK